MTIRRPADDLMDQLAAKLKAGKQARLELARIHEILVSRLMMEGVVLPKMATISDLLRLALGERLAND